MLSRTPTRSRSCTSNTSTPSKKLSGFPGTASAAAPASLAVPAVNPAHNTAAAAAHCLKARKSFIGLSHFGFPGETGGGYRLDAPVFGDPHADPVALRETQKYEC